MSRVWRSLGLLLGLVATASTIASATASAQTMKSRSGTITVDNARAVPVVVYLERGVFDTRLGTVPAHSEQTLDLPRYAAEEGMVRVFVHPEGGFDLATQDLMLKPDGNVDIYVPTNEVGYLPPPPPERIPNPGAGTTTVTVRNERAEPVTLFVERGEFDTRIGVTPANESMTFELPEWLAQERASVELFVHPERGHDLASQHFELTKGAHLLVKVPLH